jgi:protein TonB
MLLQDDSDQRRGGAKHAYVSCLDEGPGLAASLTSIALHFGVLGVFVVFTTLDSPQTRSRPPVAFLLKETRLVDPHLTFPSEAVGQNHERSGTTVPASRGVTPPASQRSLHAVTKIPTVRTPLQISPASPDLAVQLSQDPVQYGGLSGNGVLSALTSMPSETGGGVGSGTPFGETARSHGAILEFNALSQWPAVLYKVKPDYSEAARKAKCEGIVVLKLVIDEVGLPHDVTVVRGLGLGLDQKAIEAVYRWRFRPGYRGSEPVAVAANVELDFKLL